MNVSLSILQLALALHTALGAVWKSSNSEQTMPSLAAIPHSVWLGLTVPEALCAIALVVPIFERRAAVLVPIAAAFVAIEMLFFCGVHRVSGSTSPGPVIYWLVVAVLCAIVISGRLVLKPIRRGEFE